MPYFEMALQLFTLYNIKCKKINLNYLKIKWLKTPHINIKKYTSYLKMTFGK